MHLCVPLLEVGLPDASASWDRDHRPLALSDREDVIDTRGEGVSLGILDVRDIERARVLFNMLQHSDPTNIVAARAEHMVAIFELRVRLDLICLQVEL